MLKNIPRLTILLGALSSAALGRADDLAKWKARPADRQGATVAGASTGAKVSCENVTAKGASSHSGVAAAPVAKRHFSVRTCPEPANGSMIRAAISRPRRA